MTDNKQEFLSGIVVAAGGKLIGKAFDKALNKGLDKAMDKIVNRADIPVQQVDKSPIKNEVREQVVKELSPLVENLANQEPLWRSKVLWTSIGTVATSAAGIYAMVTGDSRAIELVLMIGTMVTGLGTIASRILPSKAIGR